MNKKNLIYLFPVLLSPTIHAAVKPTALTETISWEITDDNVLKVYGSGEIPSFEDKLSHWRKYLRDVKSIEIGEGITKIGQWAFSPITQSDYIAASTYPGKYNISIKNISLPSTLKSISFNAFSFLNIPDIVLPNNLEIIRDSSFAFSGISTSKLIIPESVRTIEANSFSKTRIDTLVFEGNTDIAGFAEANVKVIVFKSPDARFSKKSFRKPETIVAYSPAALSQMEIFSKNYILETTVNAYISNRLPDFSRYVSDKVDIQMPTAADARKAIEDDIVAWQIKGEFESTTDWQKRVNDTTRKERIERLTDQWRSKAADSKSEYEKQISELRAEYEALRNKYADEFYGMKTAQAQKKYATDTFTLDTPYDADNQTFLIRSSLNGDILLHVPVDEAPVFKANWETISKNATYSFAPIDETDVTLVGITFTNNGHTYVYDGSAEAQYAIADINYNFSPLQFDDITFDASVLPEIAEAPQVHAVKTAAISSRKVDVQRTTVNASTAISDIDSDIPATKTTRPETFALIIANENYRRTSAVPYAANDGASIRTYFNLTLGIPEKNILHVQDASLNDIRYNIKRIQDICNAFAGEATVIVYYAGHGVPDESTHDAFLLPVDGYADDMATGMSLAELTKTLAAMPTRQTTLFLDACFSGTGREGTMLTNARSVAIKPKETEALGNLVIFSASQGVETAHPYVEQAHGMFTYFLLKKLNESQGNITLGDLSDYINENVRRTSVVNGKMQTPTVKTVLSDWKSLKM